ncbi:hypothetical protein BkAM31D_12455 [Halalkalibacter krulwichiae]|uniref:Peptidase M50B-like protein n=1 Tax=Halalkalibacter krulwichiae TaxID=199441 RepID=A0A1X9MD58_9BACI|nr:hypothetical protein BkAM31D_12455 [Halalkalibacter krulwichiae]
MELMYLSILLALIVSFLPYLKSILGTIHTLIHETGHALAAILTSGKVYKIYLYSNTSGLAYTGSTSWLSSVIIAYAGYTFSSLVVLFAFYLIIH